MYYLVKVPPYDEVQEEYKTNADNYIKELEKTIGEMDEVLVGTYQYCERCKYLNGHVSDILEKYHGKPIEEIIK